MARELGLTAEEFERLRGVLGRKPTYTELGIASALWSEHCSYKSSKVYLRELPTSGPRVLQGPGENAGVVDVGDGWVAVFKMESHNHPSFIEPYQGAATGVGGILRDVFTMGARPIACMDSLRFGAIDAPRMRHLVDGVVRGIGDYGNCVGIPTVGGETGFHPQLQRQHPGQRLRARPRARATASSWPRRAASATRSSTSAAAPAATASTAPPWRPRRSTRRARPSGPTVQVGDPFTEKILLEACLEAMRTDAVVAIQDMGAAGLTSSSLEMAGRGGLGLRLDLDRVPLREPGLSAFEIMLSESQERMVVVARRGREEELRARLRALGARGRSTSASSPTTARAELRFDGATVGRHSDRAAHRRGAGLPPSGRAAGRSRAAPARPRGAAGSTTSAARARATARDAGARRASRGSGASTTTRCAATP